MGEIMRPMPFAQLMDWALTEYAQEKRIFGVAAEKFYRNRSGHTVSFLGQQLASPLGPAAGPNAQLAQNIVAAYLAGSRFMELKTVQKMDGAELRACVPRPCIKAEDEGYNVEWSTELTVAEAFGEYAKAWLAIHVLMKELDLSDRCDFAFNMSVGYDLAGIQGAKINSYIEAMKDAGRSVFYRDCLAWLRDNLQRFSRFTAADLAAISPCISNSVTLSTLHGCPPQEIERIATYLLQEKQLHTYVKCNPTLLGYECARQTLDEMGYAYLSFDEHHFQNDLQYDDALEMLQRLLDFAAERGLAFGVKLTNTFPVQIKREELPGQEMYLSGRALYPLSIQVAQKLARDFDGRLPISYSGGADAFNIEEIYRTGICPITVATTILKPGGYERLQQLAQKLEPLLAQDRPTVDAAALTVLAQAVPQNPLYRKEKRAVGSRKTALPLPLFDCFQAPCAEGGCPFGQQIPAYLAAVAAGDYARAFEIIAIDNANPAITGVICNHNCQNKCTRLDYETPLQIRQAKRLAVEAAQDDYIARLQPTPLRTEKRAVVVGAGPAGIAAALFLRRNGVAVTVLEKRAKPFGMVEYLIPSFRIEADALRRDFALAQKVGVEFRFGVTEPFSLAALREEYDFVVLAVGAWQESATLLQEGQEHVLDALAFLEESKTRDCAVALGKRVAIVGGGDVAMDCARAALRAPGVEQVSIVYRRTREFMPAQPEEIRLALAEGAVLQELLAPLSFDGQTLRCEKMQLADWDASGRRGIQGTGEQLVLDFDCLISATGARIDSEFFAAAGLTLDRRGRVELNEANEAATEHVYLAGDCTAGPATVAQAIADAKLAALDILRKLGLEADFAQVKQEQPSQTLYAKKGVLAEATGNNQDAARCLGCGQLCEICCDVCPNRANLRLPLAGFRDAAQILHLDGLCNECGNCGVFCPHTGDPYKHKFTLFWSREDFADSVNRGFCKTAADDYLLRLEDGRVISCGLGDAQMPPTYRAMIQEIEAHYAYLLRFEEPEKVRDH